MPRRPLETTRPANERTPHVTYKERINYKNRTEPGKKRIGGQSREEKGTLLTESYLEKTQRGSIARPTEEGRNLPNDNNIKQKNRKTPVIPFHLEIPKVPRSHKSDLIYGNWGRGRTAKRGQAST